MQGAGRYAVLQDPQGAAFCIINPENAKPEAGGMPPLGSFAWQELATTDNEAALAFYSQLFGWEAMQRMDMGPSTGIYLIFGSKGVQRGGMYNKPADMPAPPNWLPFATVPSADKAHAYVLSAGGKELAPPMDVPGGGRITCFVDPSGAAFAVHSMSAAAAPAEKPAAKPKAKAKVSAKPKAKTSAKAKPKAKAKAAKKPAARKKVVRKAAKKSRKAAPKKKKAPARKKSAAKRKK
jgi:predicted enzyme related to lactoylglutathione lyase